MRLAMCLLGTAAMGVAIAARADESPSRDYFATLGSANVHSEGWGTSGNGVTGSVTYGRVFTPRFGAELTSFASVLETGRKTTTDFYQAGLSLDAVWMLGGTRGVERTGYLLGGLGIARNDYHPDDLDGFAPLVEAGVGLASAPMFGRNVQMRIEARYVYNFANGGHAVPRVGIGIEIPLQDPPPAPPPARKAVESSAPTIVYRDRTREVVRAVPRPWIDSDRDNVDDEHDRCPATPEGAPADQFGCPLASSRLIELTGVSFDTGKAEIRLDSYAALDAVIPGLLTVRGMRIEVAGHTDSVGSAAANAKLSAARANAVRVYLESKGIAGSTLTSRGYGESDLLADPEVTPADRERNRRVELRLTRE